MDYKTYLAHKKLLYYTKWEQARKERNFFLIFGAVTAIWALIGAYMHSPLCFPAAIIALIDCLLGIGAARDIKKIENELEKLEKEKTNEL